MVALLVMAGWWALRAQSTDGLSHVLPLGASMVAFAAAFAAVRPLRGLAREAAGLGAAGLGAAAIVSSPDTGAVPWLGAVLVLAVGLAALVEWDPTQVHLGRIARLALGAGLVAVVVAAIVPIRHEVALRAFVPSDQDRSVEWSAAWHQWRSAPFIEVGPDRLLTFQAPDGTFAHFAHNEYLQIAADGGIVVLVLFVFTVVSVVRVVQRSDLVGSCATATLVCLGGRRRVRFRLAPGRHRAARRVVRGSGLPEGRREVRALRGRLLHRPARRAARRGLPCGAPKRVGGGGTSGGL